MVPFVSLLLEVGLFVPEGEEEEVDPKPPIESLVPPVSQ